MAEVMTERGNTVAVATAVPVERMAVAVHMEEAVDQTAAAHDACGQAGRLKRVSPAGGPPASTFDSSSAAHEPTTAAPQVVELLERAAALEGALF